MVVPFTPPALVIVSPLPNTFGCHTAVTCEGPSCKGLDHPRVINESEKDAHTAEIRTHQAAEEDAQAESKVSRMNVARKLGTPLEPR